MLEKKTKNNRSGQLLRLSSSGIEHMESEQLKFWAGLEASDRFFRGAEGLDPEYCKYVFGVIGLETSVRMYV
jgi:hypothetical protein